MTTYALPWCSARRRNIALDLNEFDHSHHEEVLRVMANTAGHTKYPDPLLSLELFRAMGLDPGRALLTAGSDDALDYITDDVVHRDTPCFVFVPAYGYASSIIHRKSSTVTKISSGIRDGASLSTCLAFHARDLAAPSVVYLANPSNPLGTMVESAEIENVASLYPRATFVIDEAYIEFSESCDTCAPLASRYANVVVVRTFSKAYGLAGLRLGYVIANPVVVARLRKAYNEKRVTDIAMRAGLAIAKFKNHYDACVESVRFERNALQTYFEGAGWFYVPSHANFVTFYAPGAHATFEERGVTVRDLSDHPGFEGFLRVTVGNAANMAAFTNILKTIDPPTRSPLAGAHVPKDHIWKMKLLFQKLASVLNASALAGKFWLDSGSLLGWHRHAGGAIPWDDDVDIGILESDADALLALRDRLASRGLRLKLNRTEMYYQIDAPEDWDAPATDDIHVDIFPFVKDGAHLVNRDPRFVDADMVRCNFRYAPEDLFPLRPAMWYDTVPVNVPNEYERILRDNIPSDFMGVACLEIRGERASFEVSRWVAA